MKKYYELRGKIYLSKAKIAEDYGMSKQLLNYRLNTLHMSLEEATDLKVKEYKEEILIDNVLYSSINEACECFGKDKGTVLSRISNGMDKISAIKKNNAREFPYDGKIFENVKSCCKYYTLPYQSVLQYARLHNVSKTDAIDVYRKKKIHD